jgi:LysR family hydrogen peroxide-inducible transcriptional activator
MSDSVFASLGDPAENSTERIGLEDLQVFLAVSRAGSFRAAAHQMYISQPTTSRAVARLERLFGVKLLERGARGVVVTPQGEVVLTGARRILAAAADLRRDVSSIGAGTMQLGATATSARRILAPYLAHWLPQHREIHVTAIEDSERRLHDRLANGDCDVAIVSSPLSPSLDSLYVMTAQVMVSFPPEHRLAHLDRPLEVTDLVNDPLLVNGQNFPSTSLLLRAFEASGAKANIAYECSAGQTLAAMAEAGLGIAVFGNTAVARGFNLLQKELLGPDGKPMAFDLYVAWMRAAVPAWMQEFAVELATFHQTRPPEG